MYFTPIKLIEIIDILSIEIEQVYGCYSEDNYVDNLSSMENVSATSLDWVNSDKLNKQEIAEKSKAKIIIADIYVKYSEELSKGNKILICVKNSKIALSIISDKLILKHKKIGIHSSASIHPSAIIGSNVYIGENVVIGNCVIGDNTRIYPNVVIYDNTEIGKNTVIHSGAIIRADGLGCVRKDNGELVQFPQLGKVIIGDNVYLGANMQIASGALSDTIIGDGCKINALCFIGSNCCLGKNVWITGASMLAGSVFVGDNVTIYSRVIVREHVKIGKGAVIGMGSVVTKNVPEKETWFGSPAKRKD
jgi:UDP-3-O-[3-hydroxymyristoyl] glucosamine N-acyltransferase